MIAADAVQFELGEIVFPVAGPDAWTGQVTGIMFRPGVVVYFVTWDDLQERRHYGLELTREKTFNGTGDAKP